MRGYIFPILHIFWSNLLNKFVTVEHICQRIVKCESWYDFVVLISKISDFPLFKGRRYDRMGRKVVEKLFFIRVFSFFFFFQTKFICSLLIKGSIVRSSLCIIEQYFYSRDFIIKNRVLSGWIVQMENFILFFLGWNFWNIYFWRFSFFFLRLNSDRQFVESYWGGEVNEINVGMDFVNFI